jgi:ferritin-like metal-binding protein YciE
MTLADLTLRDDQVSSLYLLHLQQIHSAEQQLLSALPGLAIHLSVADIREQLLSSASHTPEYISLIESIYSELGETPTGPVCQVAKALVDLSTQLIQGEEQGRVRDMLLISVAKEMKHMGIAKYSMAVAFAQALGYSDHVLALSNVRRSKETTDRYLTFAVEHLRLTPSKT